MVTELLAARDLEPRLTPAKAGAYAIAFAVHLLTAALVLFAVVLVVASSFNVGSLIIALFPLAIAFLLRPRLGSVPEEGQVSRETAPTLYALTDEIAAALEVTPADVIIINEDFNASWATLSLRRRRVLTLGLPLVAALEPQELVAVIAHEFAHARNGDATRGLVVGSAVDALGEVYSLLAPDEAGDETDAGIFGWVIAAIQYVVSRPILALLYLELHLLLRDTQRAEYLADLLAARVAGAEAEIGSHEKLLLASTFDAVVQRKAGRDGDPRDVFERIRAEFAAVPERERERRRRVARLEEARLSDTHPPTAHRIRLVESRANGEPLVVLDRARADAIDAELSPLRAPLEEKLVDEYVDSLYYG